MSDVDEFHKSPFIFALFGQFGHFSLDWPVSLYFPFRFEGGKKKSTWKGSWAMWVCVQKVPESGTQRQLKWHGAAERKQYCTGLIFSRVYERSISRAYKQAIMWPMESRRKQIIRELIFTGVDRKDRELVKSLESSNHGLKKLHSC